MAGRKQLDRKQEAVVSCAFGMLELDVVLAVEACLPICIAVEPAVLAGDGLCTTGG